MSWRHAALNSRRWERTRRAVFARDKWRCRCCGMAGRLECDHIVPLDKDPDQDPYDPANCQTLTRACHVLKTRRERGLVDDPTRQAWASLVRELTDCR